MTSGRYFIGRYSAPLLFSAATQSTDAGNSSAGVRHFDARSTRETLTLARGKLAYVNDVTRILAAVEKGDPAAADRLLPLVYDELRQLAAQRLAQEASGQTLQATARVHEAYLRLVASGDASAPREQHWNSRGHFF